MNPQILQDLNLLQPEIILTATLLLVVIADLLVPSEQNRVTFALTAIGLMLAFASSLSLFGTDAATLFFGMVALDPLAVFFKSFLILTSLIVLAATPGSRELSRSQMGEFYALLLGVTLGMLFLVASHHMLMLYLSLEMVSLGSYVMVGYLRNDRQSNEASLKYILFGAVSTGAMLYGITLLFGLTGSADMAAIRLSLLEGGCFRGEWSHALGCGYTHSRRVWLQDGCGTFSLLVSGRLYRSTDAGDGVFECGAEGCGFATLIRFFFTGLSDASAGQAEWTPVGGLDWTVLVLIISIMTMTLGNIAALRQENMKRLLAYSSIAHAGYALMGAVVLSYQGIQSVLIYFVTYLFMNLGAFFIVIEIHNRTGSFEVKDYNGLYKRSPFLSIAMTVFLLSLMGIPPLAGFFGKFFVFAAAVNRDLAWFAVVGALNSVVAVYYYARVVKAMVIEEGDDVSSISLSWTSQALLWAMMLPTLGMMLFWDVIQKLTGDSMRFFVGSG